MKIPLIVALILCLAVAGCAKYEYHPDPLEPDKSIAAILARDIHDPGFQRFLQANSDITTGQPAAGWDYDQLLLAALYFNPGLRVAYAGLGLRLAEERRAARRINPSLEIPLEYHSDTIDGQSPVLAGGILELVYERRAKREARSKRALALSEAAGHKVEAAAWSLRGELLGAYIDYYAATEKREFIRQEQGHLSHLRDLLQRRYELGQASGFEASNTRLALQQLSLEMANQASVMNDAWFSLAALIGLPAASLDAKQISYSRLRQLPDADAVATLTIRDIALNNRHDIRQALSEYNAVEQALKYEIEKQYPDITLSPGFIFDQGDKIWALGSAWLLPLFNRNEGAITEAMARRRIKQAEFLALQAGILNDIDRSRGKYLILNAALTQAQVLIAQLQGHHDKIKRQYELGYSDQLDVVRADLELLRATRSTFAIRIETLKALQQLEHAIQHPLRGDRDIHALVWRLFDQARPEDKKLEIK